MQSTDYVENFKENFRRQTGKTETLTVYDELNNAFIEQERLESIGLCYRLLEDYPKSLEYQSKSIGCVLVPMMI